MDPFISNMVTQGGYAVLSFAVGYLLNKSRSLTTRRKALENGVKVLLKIELRRAHEESTHRGKITYDDEALAEEIYLAYHALHGNGQGTAMLADLRKLPKV
nr:MAG TPA: minor structural protein [Bacteriophage sp.]